MQPNTPEARPQTGVIPYSPEAQTREGWANHFGVGPREVMGLIRAAIEGVVSSDEVIRTSGASSEKGNTRRRLLTAISMEVTGKKGQELYALSHDIQGRVANLVAVKNPEGKSDKPLQIKDLNGLITELNFHEMKTLVQMVQADHPDWFVESEHPRRSGGKSWWLKREQKGAFVTAAEPHIKTLLSRRVPPRGFETRRAPAYETNTQGLTGWGMSDEDIVAAEIGVWGRGNSE
ncbi:hypothetical protein KBC86_00660 [Candidatus Gracilibacteria bacterium]|nr:hypothetical protein [Candidatus Gracilibacteria bacterium]